MISKKPNSITSSLMLSTLLCLTGATGIQESALAKTSSKVQSPNKQLIAQRKSAKAKNRISAPSSSHPIKLAVASNPATPQAVLKKLADDKDDLVRRRVARHPIAPMKPKENCLKTKTSLWSSLY